MPFEAIRAKIIPSKIEPVPELKTNEITHPRLHKLIIKNFRCIGRNPVEVELDDIVVLVGPNNAGKSSILKAYEVVMSEGSTKGNLELDDFPDNIIDPDNLPEIELHTIVYDNEPGSKWIEEIEINGKTEKLVKEKWTWSDIGKPKRVGWVVSTSKWADKEKDGDVPWGAANVANSRRPEPHRVCAFDSPEDQAKEIINILVSVITDRVKLFMLEQSDSGKESDYQKLLSQIKEIRKKVVSESQSEISKIEGQLNNLIGKVFDGYEVKFDAKPEEDVEKTISLIKSDAKLLMGQAGKYQGAIEKQGSGARRTLLWAALKIVSENGQNKKSTKKDKKTEDEIEILRPHILLLDEPEICLHPSAVRQACDVLYGLPSNDNWQVMVTTHSPIFIDISRDNTTIIRVEKSNSGDVKGTTIFRPEKIKLEADDKINLKLMNIYDPYVAEFFFGGKIIVVEGDTEYTALKYVIAKKPEEYKDIHVIRARGKATIISLIKILNHFGTNYAVLHDKDSQKATKKDGTEITNPAWTINSKIVEEINKKPAGTVIRLLASLPNFEEAYLDGELKCEKPYNALIHMEKPEVFNKIENLLLALIDFANPVPENCKEWNKIEDLENI